jgi:hypothetical protein
MNAPLLVAGCLGIVGGLIHGAGGEFLVVRKLGPEVLPSSRFGGPRTTQAMIHVTWHMTTIAFLVVGGQLAVAGTAVHGDSRRALGLVGAIACTGFAGLTIGRGAAGAGSLRSLIRHPAPVLLTTTTALAWWGSLA